MGQTQTFPIEFDVKLWTYVAYINGEKHVLNTEDVRQAYHLYEMIRSKDGHKG